MNKISIKLTDGRKINLELYPDIAPITVENFLNLVDKKFFDGLCFHRCIKDFMVQGGGFYPDKKGLKPKNGAKEIKGEFNANGIKNKLNHEVGVISMARTNVPDSASSQFFICVADCGFLDGQYAAFGKTIDKESENIIKSISNMPTHSWLYFDDIPNEPIVIETIEKI